MTTKRRAADTVLLAALDCGPGEFTLADLVLACWKLDPERFGLKGHEGRHPSDHRVAAEVCGVTRHHPIKRGLIERVRPNVYRLTPLGVAVAESLNGVNDVVILYKAVAVHLSWPEYLRWQDDPAEPHELPILARTLIASVNADVRGAMKWCDEHNLAVLAWPGRPLIHYNQMAELLDFLAVLRMRFPKETKEAA